MFDAKIMHISDKVIHEGSVVSVILPGVLGQFEIVDHHVPIVSLLAEGLLTVVEGRGRTRSVRIWQGLARFDGSRLSAVVE